MDAEMKAFQRDLLESVRQMKQQRVGQISDSVICLYANIDGNAA